MNKLTDLQVHLLRVGAVTTLAALTIVALGVLAWTLLGPSTPTAANNPTTAATTTPAQPGSSGGATPGPATASFNPSAGDAGPGGTTSTSGTSSTSGTGGGQNPAETEEAAWGPVADNFARNFTNTSGGADQWRRRLTGNTAHPAVTDAVADQLKTVDTADIPAGRYSGRSLVESSTYQVSVKVDYAEGWAMVLYLITDGTTWQIQAYDKWEA